MKLEDELTETFERNYRTAGEETGYWAHRFLAAVRNKGGVATARRMLKPRNADQRKGLDTLIEANRPELSVEYVVLQEKFRKLFTPDELTTAEERLSEFRKTAKVIASEREYLYPDDLEPGKKYVEGAKKQIRVNAYERNSKARKVCLNKYGYKCLVCDFDFESRYGELGEQFIHVHHIKPLSLTDGKYNLDPIKDLRPVCPNCHAMLHRGAKVLSIEDLRKLLKPLAD